MKSSQLFVPLLALSVYLAQPGAVHGEANQLFVIPTAGPYVSVTGVVGEEFGVSVLCVDNDGPPLQGHVMVGAPGSYRSGFNTGEVYTFNPQTPATRLTIPNSFVSPLTYGYRLGASLSVAGDLDGDGIDEIVVGAPAQSQKGQAHILSVVPTGTPLAQVARLSSLTPAPDSFGRYAVSIGDLTGFTGTTPIPDGTPDGMDEFAVAAPSASPAAVYIYDGATLQPVAAIRGATARGLLAIRTTPIANQLGSRPQHDLGVVVGGALNIYSAEDLRMNWLDRTALPNLSPRATVLYMSEAAVGAAIDLGDLDNDALRSPELLVSAPGVSTSAGTVLLLAGPDYNSETPLCTLNGTKPSFGRQLLSLGNADHSADNTVEFVVSETTGGSSSAGRLYIYRYNNNASPKCELVQTIEHPALSAGAGFGTSLAHENCDFNGDGVEDLLVGAPGDGETLAGRVVFLLAQATPSPAPTPTSTPTPTAVGTVALAPTPAETPAVTPSPALTETATAIPTETAVPPLVTPIEMPRAISTPIVVTDRNFREVKKEIKEIVENSPPIVTGEDDDDPQIITLTFPQVTIIVRKQRMMQLVTSSETVTAAKNVRAKIQYIAQVQRTDTGTRSDVQKIVSKRNTVTLRKLPPGNYSTRYRVKAEIPGKKPIVTKFSPAASFTVSRSRRSVQARTKTGAEAPLHASISPRSSQSPPPPQ